MSKHVKKLVSLALALAMLCALTVPAFAADPDYVTPTGEWLVYAQDYEFRIHHYGDPASPSVVVVPDYYELMGVVILGSVIKNPNMTVISLPKGITEVCEGNGIENCTEIIYRGTEEDWSTGFRGSGKPVFGGSDSFPRRIPVKTLDGTVIDYVGPAAAPIMGAQDDPAEPEPEQPVQQPAATFTDVPADAWYSEAVNWAIDQGIANGTGNGAFSPTRECKKVEIIVFLWRANGSPVMGFNGVTPLAVKNTWATEALRWAFFNNIIGYGFDEDELCTRANAAYYIWSALHGETVYAGNRFTDLGNCTGAQVIAINWAATHGIVNGTGATTFSPDLTCDRGTIVTLLQRAYSK